MALDYTTGRQVDGLMAAGYVDKARKAGALGHPDVESEANARILEDLGAQARLEASGKLDKDTAADMRRDVYAGVMYVEDELGRHGQGLSIEVRSALGQGYASFADRRRGNRDASDKLASAEADLADLRKGYGRGPDARRAIGAADDLQGMQRIAAQKDAYARLYATQKADGADPRSMPDWMSDRTQELYGHGYLDFAERMQASERQSGLTGALAQLRRPNVDMSRVAPFEAADRTPGELRAEEIMAHGRDRGAIVPESRLSALSREMSSGKIQTGRTERRLPDVPDMQSEFDGDSFSL